MKKSNNSSKHAAKRRKLAFTLMICGISLLIISAVISFLFIQPTDFKERYRERQLSDCSDTDTAIEICQSKFGD